MGPHFLIEQRHLEALRLHARRLHGEEPLRSEEARRIADSLVALAATCEQMPVPYQAPAGVRLTDEVRRAFETILSTMIDEMRAASPTRTGFMQAREWIANASAADAPRPDVARTLRFVLSALSHRPVASVSEDRLQQAQHWLQEFGQKERVSESAGSADEG